MTAFWGSRKGCAHTWKHTVKWNTGGQTICVFLLLIFLFLNLCIFILGDGDRQRAHIISKPM